MNNTSHASTHILAVHAAVPGPSLALSRVIGALSAQGAQIDTLAVPASGTSIDDTTAPSLAELKAGLHSLAESVGAALRGEDGQPQAERLAIEQARLRSGAPRSSASAARQASSREVSTPVIMSAIICCKSLSQVCSSPLGIPQRVPSCGVKAGT